MTTTKPIYEYQATVNRVVDGDTVYLNLNRVITVEVDFGFHIKDQLQLTKIAIQDFRLSDIDAPEMVGEQKVKGIEAKAALSRMLSLGPIRVISQGQDKYGRWLATLYVTLPDLTEININDAMVKEGYATVYSR